MFRCLLVLLFISALPAHAQGMLAAGGAHVLAIDSANGGKVLAWGDNANGQLGNGATANSAYPVEVIGLTNAVAVAAGDGFSLALDSYGYVWAWGANAKGQLGDTTTSVRNTPVRVSRLYGVAQIAAGKEFALVVKSDGTVWGWGSNNKGQLGLAASAGNNYRTAPVQVSGAGFEKLQKVVAGTDFALAVKSDGSVWSWGSNDGGQLGVGNTADSFTPAQVPLLPDVVITDVAARNHVLALQDNGTLWSWGKNTMGQLGDDTTSNRATPVLVTGIADVRALAVAATWSLAVCRDGSVWGWGDNENGQLLDKTKTQRHFPVRAQGLSDIVTLSTGPAFSVAGGYMGNIVSWGANGSGQLGNGNAKDSFSAAVAVKKNAKTALTLEPSGKSANIAAASASGSADSLTLSATITPSAIDLGRMGFPLIWASIPEIGDFYLTVFGWFPSSKPIPYNGMGALSPVTVPILRNFDTRSFSGAKIYAAYGFIPSEGAGQGRVSEIFSVP